MNIEASTLRCGPIGYQDYYPALYGGIIALRASFDNIITKQLFSLPLKKVLEKNITLVYSNETRNSGINNWEIYKKFFDNDSFIKNGLKNISNISLETFKAISNNQFNDILNLIKKEGQERERLFPSISTHNMKNLYKETRQSFPDSGFKVCGAGGGGCFLIIHQFDQKEKIQTIVKSKNMKILNFLIEGPISNY